MNNFCITVCALLSVASESGAQLNMRGVFLHVLGDALGSVIVIISAVVIKYSKSEIKYMIDPLLRSDTMTSPVSFVNTFSIRCSKVLKIYYDNSHISFNLF